MFLESAALIPQFILMRKAQQVEVFTSHYIMLLMLARLLRLAFWVMMYIDGAAFLSLIIADILHTIIMGDFAYEYYKSMKTGKKILLPS